MAAPRPEPPPARVGSAEKGSGPAGVRMTGSRLAAMTPDELASAMRQLGFSTQTQLADEIGVSRSSVSLWLDGKVPVPRPVAMLIRLLVAARRGGF
jgi:DNA-binding transcriptional regulator YiaG